MLINEYNQTESTENSLPLLLLCMAMLWGGEFANQQNMNGIINSNLINTQFTTCASNIMQQNMNGIINSNLTQAPHINFEFEPKRKEKNIFCEMEKFMFPKNPIKDYIATLMEITDKKYDERMQIFKKIEKI